MTGRALLDGFGVASASAVAYGAKLFALNFYVDCYASDERKKRELDVVMSISRASVFPFLVTVVPAKV
jgi:hypothetical protein